MSLLSADDEQAVERAIGEIEQRTAGELVVVLVRRSDGYEHYRAWYALAVTLLVSWGVVLWQPLLPLAYVFGGQAVLWSAVYFVAAWSPLLRLLVPARVRHAAVQGRTQQLFIERGLTETRDRSGVLIVISEAEHEVRLLADRGIHERVGEEGWREQLAPLLAAIKRGETAAGLLRALQEIGEILARHFPPRKDDVDELPDAVVRA